MSFRPYIAFIAAGAFAVAHAEDALTLEAAVAAAVNRSARVASQAAARTSAGALVERAAELPDPKLRFGLENLPVTDADRFRYDRDFMTMQRIGVMQEWPAGEKRAAAQLRAQSEAAAEHAMLARERALVRRETALAWLDLAYALRVLERLAALERDLALELDATAPALAAGRTSAADVYALRGLREQVRDRRIAQERLIERARIELARLVGAEAGRAPGALPDTTEPPLAAGRIEAMLERHPAVAVATAQVPVARAEVERARAGKAADWSVELSFARREPAFSNMVSLVFQRDLPLWTERRQDRDVAARVAGLERALSLVEDARRAGEAELRLALADHASATRRLEHHAHALAANARERTEAALAAYRGGKGSLAAVLEARRAQNEVAIDTVLAERDRALAWAGMRYALLDAAELAALAEEGPR